MLPRPKVLGVDDNSTNLAILEEILADEYDFRTAASGEEALAAIPTMRPDVVLLDIMMPGINGYEVCREIRKDPRLRHTKVIMVSAKAQVSERIQGYEVGADDYIIKPFDEEELLFKVRVFLKLKSVQEVDRLKTGILALLSNETKTPLNSLMAPANLLMTAATMPDALRQRLGEVIHRNAGRLLGFFDRLLKLSALRAGQWRAPFESVALGGLVEDAVARMLPRATARGVRLVEQIDIQPTVAVVAVELAEVVRSLLDNAIRFSPEGGSVEVRLSGASDEAVLTVTDHGRGIDASFLPYVFDEFAEPEDSELDETLLDARVEDYIERFGLSLATARHVVELHGGSIGVESVPGEATVFSVRLPIGVDGEPERERSACEAGDVAVRSVPGVSR